MRSRRSGWLGHALARCCAACLGLVLSATAGAGQTVSVQSGEHADFTRLVLDIGAARDWRLLQEGVGRYRLTLDPPAANFAIARVFDLIPRDRLADLTIDEGLVLTLACACVVDANRYQRRYLLLDIRQGDAARPQDLLPDTAQLLARPAPTTAIGVAPTLSPPPAVPALDLEEAGRVLSMQMARAAAAGLLRASEGRPMSDGDPLAESMADAVPVPSAPLVAAEPSETAPPILPIRAQTAFDLLLPRDMADMRPGDGRTCTGAPLDMQAWASGKGVSSGLGALRAALFDARDRLQPDAVLALARHYIAFGFGAEAGFWLDQIDDSSPELRAVAGLVDAVPGPHFAPEPDPLACGDDELLWRYLDGAIDATLLTGEEAGRLLRATAALPDALRDQIAPRIARALHADGFSGAARDLRDMMWRGGRSSPGALLRLDRDLGIDPVDPAAMQQALAVGVRDAAGDRVAALAHAMAFDREGGSPQNADNITVAEALLRENGIGPATTPLWHELVLAHAAIGGLDRMLALLAMPQITSQARDATLTALFAARVAAGDTPAVYLLARSFGPAWQAEGSAAGRARVAAIAYLRDRDLTAAADALRAGQRVLILPAETAAPPAPADALRLAWQQGNWPQIATVAGGPHREVAERFLGNAPEVAATDAAGLADDLPRLSAQLADSRALRAALGALLAAPAPTIAEVAE